MYLIVHDHILFLKIIYYVRINIAFLLSYDFVQIKTHKNEYDPNEEYVCAVFNKNSSTLALIEGGGSDTNCVPYQISPKYRLSYEQMRSIVELRRCPLADRIEGRCSSHCFGLNTQYAYFYLVLSLHDLRLLFVPLKLVIQIADCFFESIL